MRYIHTNGNGIRSLGEHHPGRFLVLLQELCQKMMLSLHIPPPLQARLRPRAVCRRTRRQTYRLKESRERGNMPVVEYLVGPRWGSIFGCQDG